MLGLLFSLRFYDDSGVCSKYFQSRVSAVPWAYPLSAHGLGSIRPNLTKVRHAIFLLLQLPPSPYGSVMPKWTDQWGDNLIFWGLTDLKEDDANCAYPWQVVKQLWCTTRVALWLVFSPDRSIASSSVHFLYIDISHSSFLISPFSTETYCQSATVNLVRERSFQ